MAKNQKITLREALKKFPEVCKALLGEVDFQMLGKGLAKSDWNPTGVATTRDRLCVAAVTWLEGKPVALDVFPDEDGYWPTDMLRCLLLEVQDQLHDAPNEPDNPKNVEAAFTGPVLM